MKARTTLIILLLFSLMNLKSQTIIEPGDVYGDWFFSGSPYLITGNIHLPSDERLRIWPGVRIIFQGQYTFELEGKLHAAGTQIDSIIFSVNDTTGYSSGNYNGWNGLYFDGANYSFSDSSIMDYCNVEFSKYNGITCMSYPYLVIKNSEFRYNCSAGIALFDFSDIRAEAIVIKNNKLGGLNSMSSAPQIVNFTVKNNSGTGISIKGSSFGNLNPNFQNGRIRNNSSPFIGGGIVVDFDATAYFQETEIVDNHAINGGGIYCGMANCNINKGIISGNKADHGGGIYGNSFSNITLTYSLISKNNADYSGGGGYIDQGIMNLFNCTLSANSAGEIGGGVVYNCNFTEQSIIRNSIIWSNIPGEIEVIGDNPIVSYSDIYGGFIGIQNLDSDPLFVDPLNNDFHLSWSSFPEENGYKSPCIDAGDPNSTVDPDGTFSDMGAYYFNQGIYTSINNSEVLSDVSIYPNPAEDFLKIASDSFIDHLFICNLTGEVIIAMDTYSNYAIVDISNLHSGIYLVKLFTKKEILSINKIIKK